MRHAGAMPKRRPSTAPEGKEITLPGGHEVLLTRRHFLYGAAGVAALAVLGGATAYANDHAKGSDDLAVLTVPQEAVYDSQGLEQIEDADSVATVVATAKLPYGTLLWSSDDQVAACLLPTETAKPLAQVGLLSLESGACTTVLEHAVGEDEGFEIYDVRGNASGLIWTEADIMDGLWRVYGAKVKGEKLGKARLLDEGDGNWEMPTLAVAGAYGFWQCLPQLNGDARVENSLLKRAQFGADEAEVVYESQGRMACAPTSCGDAVIITPRARTSGTYYQMTKIDGASGTVTDACVLPTSMKPMECSYGPTGFNFAFEAIYNYGDGIANLGTYMPLNSVDTEIAAPAPAEEGTAPDGEATVAASAAQAHSISIDQANAATEAYSAAPWFRYARTPVSAPCWCGNWLMIKGSTNMCVVNLEEKKFAALPLEEGADSYKDFLASSGMGKRAVTYSSVNHTPVNGEAEKCCKVRIWETK
ncbi:MAG: Tat pathway signal protein [Adlercreutzia sp.]|nr:Tat pathway signal protein [Adlercreutzia sp.]